MLQQYGTFPFLYALYHAYIDVNDIGFYTHFRVFHELMRILFISSVAQLTKTN